MEGHHDIPKTEETDLSEQGLHFWNTMHGHLETTQEVETLEETTLTYGQLKEEKVLSKFVHEGEVEPYKYSLTHTKRIGERYYQVVQVTEEQVITEQKVNTSLNRDEVEAFLQEW